VDQDEAELVAARADREHRREMGQRLAHAVGLGDGEGRLFEVIAYSPDQAQRIRAADMLVAALRCLSRRAA